MEEGKGIDRQRRKTRAYPDIIAEADDRSQEHATDSQRGAIPSWALVARRTLMPNPNHSVDELRTDMLRAARNLEFEEAARLRDLIIQLEKKLI